MLARFKRSEINFNMHMALKMCEHDDALRSCSHTVRIDRLINDYYNFNLYFYILVELNGRYFIPGKYVTSYCSVLRTE